MATSSKWLNSATTVHAGKLGDVAKHVPSFDRRPFALPSSLFDSFRDNSRFDAIVRLPLNGDADCIPVGVVSKDYALLPHTEVIRAAEQTLEAAKIEPADVDAELRLTEYRRTHGVEPAPSGRLPIRSRRPLSNDGPPRMPQLGGRQHAVPRDDGMVPPGLQQRPHDRRHKIGIRSAACGRSSTGRHRPSSSAPG